MIKFLQDAAGKGDLDPWDIDVISVIDSFLERYSQTFGGKSNSQDSYHKDLSETSEAFFAASVLVNLKAQVLESDVFKENHSDFEDDFDVDDQDWIDQEFDIPKYPEKYLSVGISEQNMIGVASGLAKEGFKVFVTSFAPFLSMRASEQIRMNLGYMKLPVNLVALGSGVSMGYLGNSHFGLEDIAVMRTIPGLNI